MTKYNAEVKEFIAKAIIEYAKANPYEWPILQLNDHLLIQDASGEEWVFDVEPAREAIENYDDDRMTNVEYIVPKGTAGLNYDKYQEPEPDGDWSYSLWEQTGDGRV